MAGVRQPRNYPCNYMAFESSSDHYPWFVVAVSRKMCGMGSMESGIGVNGLWGLSAAD